MNVILLKINKFKLVTKFKTSAYTIHFHLTETYFKTVKVEACEFTSLEQFPKCVESMGLHLSYSSCKV